MYNYHKPNGRLGHAMQCVSKTRSVQKPHRDPNLECCSYISVGSSHTQWLFVFLTSPNYNGIFTPLHLTWSCGYVCRSISTVKVFHACQNEKKKTFVKLCRMCFVTRKTVTPGEQSVAKLGFKRVWVSTLLNGLDSSLRMPDRLYIKLSQEP